MSPAVALTPRVRIMVICDAVWESKIKADVFDLEGVRQSMTVEAVPFVPLQLWLFLVLSSPRAGSFPGYVRIVNDRTEKAVFYHTWILARRSTLTQEQRRSTPRYGARSPKMGPIAFRFGFSVRRGATC